MSSKPILSSRARYVSRRDFLFRAGEGIGFELDVIAAVVIGGTLLTGGVGSVPGTLVGVLIIGLILSAMTYEAFSSGLTKVAIGTLLFAFVLLQRLLTRGGTR